MNDQTLRKSVLDELQFEPSIDANDIGVTAENGVVTLTGHVTSYMQKIAAERAAWRVKGVKAIAQEIEVRLPTDKKVRDDEIAQRALNVLEWDTLVPRDAIHVKVTGGWVTLSGQVDWNYQRSAAEYEVRKLSGVIGVVNSIILSPAVQTSNVHQRIVDALKRHAEIEANRIQIDVTGGTVKIEGEVDDWDERRAIERAIWATPGVKSVDNRVRIS
ncbi:BON domain-containing protein [Frateuria defendens]|uniref:BON domain-containing protein n=1 Tax=Frateuria defendens TaxID=2219559 RepID=UPI00066FBC68|nr:BON domain-containing protein [Frateuria defendens]